ncbi:unnamed protein product, partial [Rotaria sordida]
NEIQTINNMRFVINDYVKTKIIRRKKDGSKVISRSITMSHILSVNKPFSGRSSNLSSRISGMLINPNCEFELNFIPLNTLIDWLPEFNKIKSAIDLQQILKIDHSLEKMSPKEAVLSLIIDEDSQDSISESQTSIASSKIHRMEYDASGTTSDLTLDDIRLLVELFYLPYEHRPNAQQMFIVFYWLRFNYDQNKKLNEWRCRTSVFHTNVKNFNHFVQRLTTIHSRSLLYNVYNYVIDINSTVTLCSRYLY